MMPDHSDLWQTVKGPRWVYELPPTTVTSLSPAAPMVAGQAQRVSVYLAYVDISMKTVPPDPVGKKTKKNRSDITPDPGGHRAQRPRVQGRTCAKQDWYMRTC